MTRYVHCDFEFNDAVVIVGCFLDSSGKHAFDCRTEVGREAMIAWVKDRPRHVFCSYSAAAEVQSLMRCGMTRDDIKAMRWLDLMVEANMITGTRADYWVPKKSLLTHLQVFEVDAGQVSAPYKAEMHSLILSKAEFTDAEVERITAYCWADVMPLPKLLAGIVGFHEKFHASAGHETWTLPWALYRGKYVAATAVLQHRTKGLPIDVPYFMDIAANQEHLRSMVAMRCNEHYGVPFYEWSVTDRRYKFKTKAFENWIAATPLADTWKRTATGKLSLAKKYLDEMEAKEAEIDKLLSDHRNDQSIRTLKETRDTIKQLSVSIDQLEDGFIQPVSVPYWTTTGRNQPLVSKGFLLNASPWFRHVIRPAPGMVMIQGDWSRQEIGIAVALSGDVKLREAYEEGDIYANIGRMAGAITDDMDKDSKEYEFARQKFKSLQLGLAYGTGIQAIADMIRLEMLANGVEMTPNEAFSEAETIYNWHKATFTTYWSYLEGEVEKARANGFTCSRDAWVYFADKNTKHTQLLNFPMQSNGAAMLRAAMIELAFNTNLNVICSLHDAIYIYSPEDRAAEDYAVLEAAMSRAVTTIIGPETKISVGKKEYTSLEGYSDKRGVVMKEAIDAFLSDIHINGAPPEPTIKSKRISNKALL